MGRSDIEASIYGRTVQLRLQHSTGTSLILNQAGLYGPHNASDLNIPFTTLPEEVGYVIPFEVA